MRFTYTQVHMGVPVRVVVYSTEEATAERACKAAFARVAELDNALSDYRPDSELNRLCKQAGGAPVKVNDDLFTVLWRSQEFARRSDGAFDATVGPLVRLWRQTRMTKQLPSEEELNAAKTRVGWQKVRLDPQSRTVQLTTPGMQLDLGGIGKGYAGDCALAALRKHGVTRALFEAGGDIVVGDPPPGKDGWTIELFDQPAPSVARLPASLATSDLPRRLRRAISRLPRITNCAISTSGDTEQFVEIDGKRYSHIVDPRTGLGLTDRIAVTVTAKQGIISDALATTISVLGAEKARALARRYPGTEVFVRTL